MRVFLSAVTVDTTSAALPYVTPTAVFASGGFGGGTLTLSVAGDDNVFVPFATLTAAGVIVVNSPGSFQVKAALTGASAASLTVASL
jgi:hypothetical protein